MKNLLITPDRADFSLFWISLVLGFPSGSVVKESACQYGRHRVCSFDPWVRKIPWRRTWQPTPVFLPGESHGQRSLAGYSHRVAKSQTWLSNYACSHTSLKWFASILYPAFKPAWFKWFLNYKHNVIRKTYTANSAGHSHRRHTGCLWGSGDIYHFLCPSDFFNSQSQVEIANRAG